MYPDRRIVRLDGLDSRMVIPLRNLKHFPQVKLSTRLTPLLTIQGEKFLLETPIMANALRFARRRGHGTWGSDPHDMHDKMVFHNADTLNAHPG